MNATTVAVDLAKNVFQLAVADSNWRVVEKHRLTRAQFERFFANRETTLVVMEACGSAHYWARQIQALGIEVRLLPPRYIRAYVKRNKTDAADAAALLEATRCADIAPVKIKSIEQQALQCLHRTREQWMRTRTARINGLRASAASSACLSHKAHASGWSRSPASSPIHAPPCRRCCSQPCALASMRSACSSCASTN